MKILIIHNHYQIRGGEDAVFENECALLENGGHSVVRYEVSNDEIPAGFAKCLTFFKTIWNAQSARGIRELIRREKPEIAHFHNTLHLVSPAAYWACKAEGVPVVQTLHNFRLCCLNVCLMTRGAICEDCVGKNPWRGVRKKCYRDSYAQSLAIWAMLTFHRLIGTYRNKIDAYIALTEFGKQKMIEAGLPAHKIHIKSNVCPAGADKITESSASESANETERATILFVGRLSPEKGLRVLLDAWRLCQDRLPRNARLIIAGAGPDRAALEPAAPPSVSFAGRLTQSQVLELMRGASAIACPSIWYETFGMSILEASSCALPAIASNLGAFAELIEDNKTGYLFPAGDAAALSDALTRIFKNPVQARAAGEAARRAFLYSESIPSRNLARLLEIYETARKQR